MTEQTGAGPEPAHERASATQIGAWGPEGLPDEVGVDPDQADRATTGAGRARPGSRRCEWQALHGRAAAFPTA